jgi:hypothetical protein
VKQDVLVDTSIWIDFFRHPDAESGAEMVRLLKLGHVSTCGVIVAEILQGAANENELKELGENLKGLSFLDADESAYVEAGRLSYNLRKRGRTVPLTDALIANLAIRYQQTLWTKDAHFRGIPGLELKP